MLEISVHLLSFWPILLFSSFKTNIQKYKIFLSYHTRQSQVIKMPKWFNQKGAFLFFLIVKISKFMRILGDELGCVFLIFWKKKRTSIRHLKFEKVRFFVHSGKPHSLKGQKLKKYQNVFQKNFLLKIIKKTHLFGF